MVGLNKKSIEFLLKLRYNRNITFPKENIMELRYIVITICLVYMLLLVASFIVKLLKSNRKERLKMVRGYAKGRFVLIYICAIPLFFLAMRFTGAGLLESLIESVQSSVELVVLKLEFEIVSALVEKDLYFAIVVLLLYGLCIVNLGMVSLAIFYQKLSNFALLRKATMKGKEVYVVVGGGENNRNVLTTIEGEKIWILRGSERDSDSNDFAYVNKTAIVNLKNNRLDDTLSGIFKEYNTCTIRVIINTANDETNLLYTEEVAGLIKKIDHSTQEIDDARGLHVYVFGEPENSTAFLHFVKETSGQITYVNKYKLVAFDFVDNHPLTEYMDENEIDYDTATLKSDVDVNVVMVGYDKTMQEILVTSIANNQFCSLGQNGELQENQVRYSIFPKEGSKTTEKNLNHTYYRYCIGRKKMVEEKEKYLPLPELPALVDFKEEDVNDYEFYTKVRLAITPKDEGRKSFNQIIIAYGSDIENVDVAEKIATQIKEWGYGENSHVFVKVNSKELTDRIIKDEYKKVCEITAFGSEKDVVYNAHNIIQEGIETMARHRHLDYAVVDAIQNNDSEEEAKNKALKKWYSWAQPQREANVYGVLALRMKLHLMGFDYKKGEASKEINEEYLLKYQEGDPIKYQGEAGDKPIVVYTNDFVKGSLRERMAMQEHQRWNAYMITQGMIPSTKEEIMEEGSKNYALRRQGCLTSFEGLVTLRQMLAKRNNSTEEECDVIRYDYQILDDVIWLLERNNMALTKKTK